MILDVYEPKGNEDWIVPQDRMVLEYKVFGEQCMIVYLSHSKITDNTRPKAEHLRFLLLKQTKFYSFPNH